MKKCKKVKISFLVSENIILFIVASCCIFALVATYHIDCVVTRDITMSITTSVLASVLIPIGLNLGKVLHEKRTLHNLCKSLIELSVVLIGRLNGHIALTGTKPFSCYSDLRNQENLSTVDFNGFEALEELFLLMPPKLNRMVEMEYISMSENLESIAKRLDSSIPVAIRNRNYKQLFRDLIIVIGMVGNVKAPLGKGGYIKQFDAEIQKSYREAESVYFRSTDEYIVQCLENDLSQMMNEV